MKITAKLTLVIATITILVVLLNIIMLYSYSRLITQKMTQAHLNSVSILKENQINEFIIQESYELKWISGEEELVDLVSKMDARPGVDYGLYRTELRSILDLSVNSTNKPKGC